MASLEGELSRALARHVVWSGAVAMIMSVREGPPIVSFLGTLWASGVCLFDFVSRRTEFIPPTGM
jgi:hypothetical protein